MLCVPWGPRPVIMSRLRARWTVIAEDDDDTRSHGRARPSIVAASVGGALAAVAAGAVMAVLRWALQVRTIPERVLEWLLLFIPRSSSRRPCCGSGSRPSATRC